MGTKELVRIVPEIHTVPYTNGAHQMEQEETAPEAVVVNDLLDLYRGAEPFMVARAQHTETPEGVTADVVVDIAGDYYTAQAYAADPSLAYVDAFRGALATRFPQFQEVPQTQMVLSNKDNGQVSVTLFEGAKGWHTDTNGEDEQTRIQGTAVFVGREVAGPPVVVNKRTALGNAVGQIFQGRVLAESVK